MAVHVPTVLDDRIAQYIARITAQRQVTEAAVVRELIDAGYEETVRQLHARYQCGALTFRAVAAELGLGCPKTPFLGKILCPVFGPGKDPDSASSIQATRNRHRFCEVPKLVKGI